jgi:hypothetical protein
MIKKKLIFFIPIFIILFAALLIFITSISLNNISKSDFYDLEGEKVPSIKYVLGERKISGYSSKISNSILYKQYTYYEIDSVIDDVQKYVDYLCNNESFKIIEAVNPNDVIGKISLSKNTSQVGKGIVIIIQYELGRYSINIEKIMK